MLQELHIQLLHQEVALWLVEDNLFLLESPLSKLVL